MVNPEKEAFTFQDGFSHIQQCHTESPGIEERGWLERRMAAGKPLVTSVLAAGSVYKAGSAHTLWAASPQ